MINNIPKLCTFMAAAFLIPIAANAPESRE